MRMIEWIMNPTRSDSIRPSERRARRSSVHRPRLDVLAVVRSRASPSSRLRRARSNDESINHSIIPWFRFVSFRFVSFRFVSFRFVSIDILMRHFDRPVDRPRDRSKGPGVTHHPRVIASTTRRHASRARRRRDRCRGPRARRSRGRGRVRVRVRRPRRRPRAEDRVDERLARRRDEDGRTASAMGTIGRRAVRMRERDERADGDGDDGRGGGGGGGGGGTRRRRTRMSIEARGWRRGDSGRRRGRRTRRSRRRFERCER